MKLSDIRKTLRQALDYWQMPALAKSITRQDKKGLPRIDPGTEACIAATSAWLAVAQDCSSTCDGGIARHYSLLDGWGPSYPETSGYIVPTFVKLADHLGNEDFRERARRILDWLVGIQLPDGGFQGGVIGQKPVLPVSFNTGQILIGLASGATEFGSKYHDAMERAANWLVSDQDDDGCWRNHPSPFAVAGEKVYDTHIAWGLLEAARLISEPSFKQAAIQNIDWALSRQQENGWFESCCLFDAAAPLTHTLGYTLRGIIETFLFTRDERFLDRAIPTAMGLMSSQLDDGQLPGRLRCDWSAAVPWVCLTGSAQVAICWFLLFRETGKVEFLDAALATMRYLRRTVNLDGPADIRGGIRGSFPIHARGFGGYGPYTYLNWAAKFFVDASLLESDITAVRKQETAQKRPHPD